MAGDFSVTVEVPNLLAVQARLEELGVVKVPLAMSRVMRPSAKLMQVAIQAEAPVGDEGTRTHKALLRWQASTFQKRMAGEQVKEFKAPGGLLASVRFKAGKTTKELAAVAGLGQQIRYYMVGPFVKGSSHRHLVIAGHEIGGHAPNLTHTGKRTTPNPFVERGRKAGEGPAVAAIEAAAKVALAEAERL